MYNAHLSHGNTGAVGFGLPSCCASEAVLSQSMFNIASTERLGKRGNYNGEPIQLELLPGSKPFHAKPFSIPKAYQQNTKDEIARLESIWLFSKVTSSEWAAPTFIILKKNHTVRVITDFHGLNKCLKCNPYPMP
jgi:hypothetical protein